MNRIVKSLLNDFIKSEEIKNSRENESFEHFCNYTVIANQYNRDFDFNDISTGGGGDTGIDGIGIIVNGNLVNSEDDIDSLYENNNYLEVDLIFIQSKTSSKFDGGDILKFYQGILDFFKDTPTLPKNNEVANRSALINKILDSSEKLKRSPNIKVFYITTGKKSEDEYINATIKNHKQELLDLSFFEKIDVVLLGAEEIIKLYRKARTQISKKFIFERKINLPKIKGVKDAYYGVLPFTEFKKILFDDNDHILNMFDDNVRDFQGDGNSVNNEIFKTLESENPHLFSVLNNGVTVVADDAVVSGDSITIIDYQIVNGCQTSNVLFAKRNNNKLNDMNIPLRLIITQDSDVKNNIIRSTNSQTAIKKEQLSAMSDFQKGLELYYTARLKEGEIYYERRSKQYPSGGSIKKVRIISIKDQAKSYSAMFRQDAHLATTYFGKLADDMIEPESGLCDDEHKYAPYYMAGLAYYKLESLFRSKAIDTKFRKVRFYVLMLVLMIVADKPNLLHMNSERETDKFCKPIIDKLLDEETCLKIFQKAVDIIDLSGADIEERQEIKSKRMTTLIINTFNKDTDRI